MEDTLTEFDDLIRDMDEKRQARKDAWSAVFSSLCVSAINATFLFIPNIMEFIYPIIHF